LTAVSKDKTFRVEVAPEQKDSPAVSLSDEMKKELHKRQHAEEVEL